MGFNPMQEIGYLECLITFLSAKGVLLLDTRQSGTHWVQSPQHTVGWGGGGLRHHTHNDQPLAHTLTTPTHTNHPH